MVSCKMFQLNQSIDHENWSNHVKPQLLPVPSQLYRHFPSIDRSQPPLGMRLQVFSFDEVFEAWNIHDFPWIFPYPCQLTGGNAMNPQKGCRSYCRFTTTCTFENIFERGFCLQKFYGLCGSGCHDEFGSAQACGSWIMSALCHIQQFIQF